MYNIWILLQDSLGSFYFRKLGNFNVSSSGALVDASGNPVTLSIPNIDTINLGRAYFCVITIDEGFVSDQGPTRILGGVFRIYADSISADLTFNDTLALGSVGSALLGHNSVLYFINTPTNN